ncbi:S-layer homology domain-containing protein [Anaerobacillus isosaccharinicus]|uniref:S-layer homology domain-containing protein n=1 Tax=Anaerobacillus isosaccharinicus TaxID=1532552 RepID=A0A1S2LXP3_9BACI|nr:S-layer homology domain-containing protein [Anaerobacillus isosaccharinicus]MBA5584465.1 S-layer homology domain-containing protein [Anaerobacillus isosaccharinicus]QOY37148.1 S-layer homology domain-containing protein [Anaerobacillus isosaccharinicus]
MITNKRFIKKAVAMFLSAILFLGLLLPATPSFAEGEELRFLDVGPSSYAKEAVYAMAEVGMIRGMGNGYFGTTTELYRRDAIVLFARTLLWDLTNVKDPGFVDVKPSVSYYNAVAKAVELNVIKNTSNQFKPDEKVTRGEMALLLSAAFQLKIDPTSPVPLTDISGHKYEDAIKAVYQSGLAKGYIDNTFAPDRYVTRGDYVTFIYRNEQVKENIKLELERIEQERVDLETLKLKSFSANSANSLKVEFNKQVDLSNATFELKQGLVPRNLSSVELLEDKKSAILKLPSKLVEGEYIVSVISGEETFTAKVYIEKEKVAKIELLNDKAPLDGNTVIVSYKILNQYGEDITKQSTTPRVNWASNLGTVTASNGLLTIIGTTNTFKIGTKFTLTGIESQSNSYVTKEITVSSPAVTDKVTIKEIYHPEGKELDTGSSFTEYFLLIEAEDQYGNPVSATKFNREVTVTSSNPNVVNVSATAVSNKGPNADMIAVQLMAPAGNRVEGTATINMVIKQTTKTERFSVTVKKAATVSDIQLYQPEVVVTVNEVVEIPFVAFDQFGKEVHTFSGLNGLISLSATAGSLKFVNDFSTNKAKLKYSAPNTAGTHVLIAVTPNGALSTIRVDVKELAAPTIISSVESVVENLIINAQTSFSPKNLKVKDQYGRDFKLDASFFANYRIVLSAADGLADKVTGFGALTAEHSSLTLRGLLSGSEKIKVSIEKRTAPNAGVVTGSEIEFTMNVIDKSEITEYVVEDIGTIFDDGIATTHAVDLIVYGKKFDGSIVAVPSNMYTVITTDTGLIFRNGKLDANKVSGLSDTVKVVEKKVIITIDAAKGPVVISKNVLVTNETPEIVTIEASSTGLITVIGDELTGLAANLNTATKLFATLTFKDQYGVIVSPTVTASKVYATITNLEDLSTPTNNLAILGTNGSFASQLGLTNFHAGDKFIITFTTQNGTSISLKVVGN